MEANDAALKISTDLFYERWNDTILNDEPATSEMIINFGAYMLELGIEVARMDMERVNN